MGPVYLRQDKIARWANKLLGRAGKPFWQEEYFEGWLGGASRGGRESGSEDPRGLKSTLR
jgi:hypothetical protein